MDSAKLLALLSSVMILFLIPGSCEESRRSGWETIRIKGTITSQLQWALDMEAWDNNLAFSLFGGQRLYVLAMGNGIRPRDYRMLSLRDELMPSANLMGGGVAFQTYPKEMLLVSHFDRLSVIRLPSFTVQTTQLEGGGSSPFSLQRIVASADGGYYGFECGFVGAAPRHLNVWRIEPSMVLKKLNLRRPDELPGMLWMVDLSQRDSRLIIMLFQNYTFYLATYAIDTGDLKALQRVGYDFRSDALNAQKGRIWLLPNGSFLISFGQTVGILADNGFSTIFKDEVLRDSLKAFDTSSKVLYALYSEEPDNESRILRMSLRDNLRY